MMPALSLCRTRALGDPGITGPCINTAGVPTERSFQRTCPLIGQADARTRSRAPFAARLALQAARWAGTCIRVPGGRAIAGWSRTERHAGAGLALLSERPPAGPGKPIWRPCR